MTDLDRRTLLTGMAASGAAAATSIGPARAMGGRERIDRRLCEAIETVVVIYAENRSFNNLFAQFLGLEQPLAKLAPERATQLDRDGSILPYLPPIWDGLVPAGQVVEHCEFEIGQGDLPAFANAPFALTTPDGDPLPHGVVTRDLIHSFYSNQLQINGGRNDGFVAWGDSGALVMGYYGNSRANLRLWQVAREFSLCDNFFMGAFGGSFLNHQYLIAARPPIYRNADSSPAKDRIVRFDPAFPGQLRPLLQPGTPTSAMDGPVRFTPDTLSPDFYAVNTMLPPYLPSYEPDSARPGYALATSPNTLPAQNHAMIGDRLSAGGVDWAWYAGGWAAALEGHGQSQDFP